MKVRIMLDDLADGEKDSLDSCPAALAIARALDVGFHQVRVYGEEIKVYAFRQVLRRSSPTALRRFVARWDAGETVAPCEFEI